MRLAIIGNMNNAGFALMRYFRDLGADASLLTYSTDGCGGSSHFGPESDTWNLPKWQPFIGTLPVPNSSEAVVGRPTALRPPTSTRRIREALAPYDRFVASGVAPALFERLGKRLDIFFPYSIGIEFYGTTEFRARMATSALRRVFHEPVRRLQASGIRNARYCLNAELSLTKRALEEIGKPFQRLGVPAVYNREPPEGDGVPKPLREALARIAQADLSLFSAARQYWVREPIIPEAEWPSATKNNDWLFRGLAEFVRAHPRANPLLTVVEYGQDVEASKRLSGELGIERHVQWLPVLPRREIMLLLEASHIGVGEFYTDRGLLWGGTGWETLASGRPLLQAFNFTHEGFEEEFGHAPPPILDARSSADVARQLSVIFDSPDKGRAIGRQCAEWFDEHGGIGLARRWLHLLQTEEQAP